MSISDLLPAGVNAWLAPPLLGLALVVAWLVFRQVQRSRNSLSRVLGEIAVERYRGLVIPGAHEGEIQIDELLLTANGLLILEVKDVQGVVFGSDKMQDWTVMSAARRYTIPNPQPAMFDRIAAVRGVVREVPVTGRVLFLDGAEFTKGVPSLVCSLVQLADEFCEPDTNAAKSKTDAFRPYWERLSKAAISAESGAVSAQGKG